MQINSDVLEKIRQDHHLSLILLHGSQVTGQTHPDSDIDVAVVREKIGQAPDFLKLTGDLAAALKSDRIDLSDITHANPLLLYSVSRHSQLLCGTKMDYDRLLLLAFHRYSDYLPFLKKEAVFVREQLKQHVSS